MIGVRLNFAGEVSEVGVVADSFHGGVSRRAVSDSAPRPEIHFGDGGVREVEVVLPRAVGREAERPPDHRVNRSRVGEDEDLLARMPLDRILTERRHPGGEFADGLAALDSRVVGLPQNDVRPLARLLEEASGISNSASRSSTIGSTPSLLQSGSPVARARGYGLAYTASGGASAASASARASAWRRPSSLKGVRWSYEPSYARACPCRTQTIVVFSSLVVPISPSKLLADGDYTRGRGGSVK